MKDISDSSHSNTPYRFFSRGVIFPAIAACVDRLTLHPLDTTITFQQKNKITFLGAIELIKNKFGFKGFYKGLTFPLICYSIPPQIILFGSYQTFKQYFEEQTVLSTQYSYLASSFLTGCVATIAFCPVDAKRTRDTLDIRLNNYYRLSVIYRGFTPVLFKGLAHAPIALAATDIAKTEYLVINEQISSFLYGAFFGALAQVFTTPLDVIKTYYMSSYGAKSLNFWGIAKHLYAEKQLFNSLGTRTIRFGLNTAIMFFIFDTLNSLLSPENNDLIEENPLKPNL